MAARLATIRRDKPTCQGSFARVVQEVRGRTKYTVKIHPQAHRLAGIFVDVNAAKNILEYGRADRNQRTWRVGAVRPLIEASSQE